MSTQTNVQNTTGTIDPASIARQYLEAAPRRDFDKVRQFINHVDYRTQLV